MKVSENTQNQVVNNIFSGSYQVTLNAKKGKYYEFSSPSFPVSRFSTPYDVYLPNSTGLPNAVGARIRRNCPISSDRTGALYFYENSTLIGGCHGYGHTNTTYYNGFNFYHAFYPMGYFSPPFGESVSIFKANQDGYLALENGACNNLTVTEYNELFGIVSKSADDASILSSTLTPSIYSPIFSPREACPPEVASASYYDEIQFNQIPGASPALGGNTSFNSNPIPTSLDSFDIKVNGRYEIYESGDVNYLTVQNKRPVPSYGSNDQGNKLNNNLCQATLMETKVSSSRGTNGIQLITAPDANQGAIGDQVSFAGAAHFQYWHFTFRENAETLPFSNNFVGIEGGEGVRQRKLNEGTQLFLPVLSSEDSYWKNRQCADVIDFQPFTFGANIYACPSEHFDIPYYSALRKFGFYGTRFLNTCKALNLENSLSGVPNASEIEESDSDIELGEDVIEPEEIDKNGSWSFPVYDNLLKVAKAEERYANMYALNKGFFLWANSGHISSDAHFNSLISRNANFLGIYNSLVQKFQTVFSGGMASFTGNEPNIILKSESNRLTIISSGVDLDILSNNDVYNRFKQNAEQILTGNNDLALWNEVEKKYAYYVSDGNGIDDNFYQTITEGREKRLRTRYFENILRGNPIDLFPLNNITYSYDSASDYIESSEWARSISSFGANSDLPAINRRYFEGAYGKNSTVTGLIEKLNSLSTNDLNYYFPGYFHDVKVNKLLPTPTYVQAISGKILDSEKRSFSPSGWLGLGFNEVGKLDGNFSCFTPIFVQQPLPTVFCKIGQHPTFRTLAVDYHSIPEDKISRRNPEVIYWCHKLKLLDCNGRNLYPLKYKWFRVPKSRYQNILNGGYFFSSGVFANQTGEWACIEGDGPNCTLFHPEQSYPIYTGVQSENDYTFIKGAIKNTDDQYYYFCSVSGRFGLRISNPLELNIEDWVRFDMSVKNGLNMPGEVEIDFEINDYEGQTRRVTFTSDTLQNYGGYEQDTDAIPESVVEQKIPPPNAGYGDVVGFRFIGPHGYIGATRSYTPSRLTDTRGLREIWGHFLEYGQLMAFSKLLNQNQGDWLYGYKHLPTCESYAMPNGKAGVKVVPKLNGVKISHWALEQKAVASLDMKAGVQWNRLLNLGELYPPSNSLIDNVFPNMGIGHWQWGNNLGAIKRFGKFSTKKDIMFVGGNFATSETVKNEIIEKIKDQFIGGSELAGENCGFTKHGLGRNVVYYLEAFERFYIICDPLKKKNVSNKTFLCPGLRMNNSAIQYSWLGKPHNTYVKRRAMYGPYAFQWRVERHNRDRNGNGMSEGFHSMGHSRRYSLMYDAPSIYGLYVKIKTNSRYKTLVQELKNAKQQITQTYGYNNQQLRGIWFGERGSEGTSRQYGDITYSCNESTSLYNKELCEYVGKAQALASNLNFADHKCPQDLLNIGACFDPCLSMRYAQGFYPGGKLLDLFGYGGNTSQNDVNDKTVKIVPLASLNEDSTIVTIDEISNENDNLKFRSPINTPHARITRGVMSIDGTRKDPEFVGGISTCQDGGSDHCNYNTPTIHLGLSSFLKTDGNVFSFLKNYAAEVYYSTYNTRGEIT